MSINLAQLLNKKFHTMKIKILSIFLLLFSLKNTAQIVNINKDWKFQKGDDKTWAKPELEDATWSPILSLISYEKQGFEGYKGYSWYRIKFFLPEKVREGALFKERIRVVLAKIDGANEVFLNGEKIGQTGSFPEEKGGFVAASTEAAHHLFDANNPAVRWNQENVIAVRAYGKGGMYEGDCSFDMATPIDYIKFDTSKDTWNMTRTDTMSKKIFITNNYEKDLRGSVQTTYWENGKRYAAAFSVKLKAKETLEFLSKTPAKEDTKIELAFTEMKTFKQIIVTEMSPKGQIATPTKEKMKKE